MISIVESSLWRLYSVLCILYSVFCIASVASIVYCVMLWWMRLGQTTWTWIKCFYNKYIACIQTHYYYNILYVCITGICITYLHIFALCVRATKNTKIIITFTQSLRVSSSSFNIRQGRFSRFFELLLYVSVTEKKGRQTCTFNFDLTLK